MSISTLISLQWLPGEKVPRPLGIVSDKEHSPKEIQAYISLGTAFQGQGHFNINRTAGNPTHISIYSFTHTVCVNRYATCYWPGLKVPDFSY